MNPLIIAPSVLAADFAHLGKDVQMINRSAAQWVHVDIMDGVFVPNLSFGLPVTQAIKRESDKPLDVHLMITQPERYLEDFRKAGAEVLTVHYEACPHLHRTLQQIKELGAIRGVALNPHTPVQSLECVLGDIDLVCLMSVNPGFGGQQFIEHTFEKVKQLASLRKSLGLNFRIEIDGGVNARNAGALVSAGADVLVAGSFVFQSQDPEATISALLNEGAKAQA
jgi:ribulose-phosphate 3-epimerase